MTAQEILETVRSVGGELWAVGDKLRYRLPPGAPDVVPAMRELKPQLLDLLRTVDDPDAWREAFQEWLKSACTARNRCSSSVSCLHIMFCEWTVTHSTVAPCTRQTFQTMLGDTGYQIADGTAIGLVLLEDWEAALERGKASSGEERFASTQSIRGRVGQISMGLGSLPHAKRIAKKREIEMIYRQLLACDQHRRSHMQVEPFPLFSP